MELTVVMPCLNEAETVETCVRKALACMREHGIDGEVLIADNGSTDGSQQIAREAGARVVHVDAKGYGNALMGGIRAARGRYVIMGDADDSYDFTALLPFVEQLRDGADLVMGNRFKGGIAPGAMPPLHRYLGNPVLSFIGRLFFPSAIGDFHCGLRGFRRDAILRLGLQTGGMEFASEMVVRSTLSGLDVREVPTTLSPDGRSRPPHLRSWRDGWRHLRFLLLYSPRWLFFIPGLVVMTLGLVAGAALTFGPVYIGKLAFDVDTLVGASAMVVIGFQAVLFALFAKVYAAEEGFLPESPRVRKLVDIVSLEKGLVVGGLLALAGLAGLVASLVHWQTRSFGPLIPSESLRIVVPSATALIVSFQTIFAALFISILGIRRTKETPIDVAASAAEEAAEAVSRAAAGDPADVPVSVGGPQTPLGASTAGAVTADVPAAAVPVTGVTADRKAADGRAGEET